MDNGHNVDSSTSRIFIHLVPLLSFDGTGNSGQPDHQIPVLPLHHRRTCTKKICCAADDQDIVDLLILDPPHSREPLIVIIGSQRSFFPSELSDFSLPRVCSVE